MSRFNNNIQRRSECIRKWGELYVVSENGDDLQMPIENRKVVTMMYEIVHHLIAISSEM